MSFGVLSFSCYPGQRLCRSLGDVSYLQYWLRGMFLAYESIAESLSLVGQGVSWVVVVIPTKLLHT